VCGVALDQRASRALVSSEGGALTYMTFPKGAGARLAEGDGREVETVALSGDGKIGAAGAAGGVRVFNLEKEKLVATLVCLETTPLALALSPDGKLVAAGTDDGLLRVWDLPEGRLADTLELRPSLDLVRALAFVGARTLFAGTDRGFVLKLAVSEKK
jgi:WD40 repeat protein